MLHKQSMSHKKQQKRTDENVKFEKKNKKRKKENVKIEKKNKKNVNFVKHTQK